MAPRGRTSRHNTEANEMDKEVVYPEDAQPAAPIPRDWLGELQAEFAPEDIEWRIGRSGIKDGRVWATALCYLTNRAIQSRLDRVFGPFGWANEFKEGPGGGTVCGLSARNPDTGEWVTKWDGAQAPDTEPVKGVLSDAMKRAAVQWGIGRYLYKLTEEFVDTKPERFPGAKYGMHIDKQDKKRTAFYWLPPGETAPADAKQGKKSDAPAEKPAGNPEARRMKSRFDGTCAFCQGEIVKGSDIVYLASAKEAHHPACWDARVEAELQQTNQGSARDTGDDDFDPDAYGA